MNNAVAFYGYLIKMKETRFDKVAEIGQRVKTQIEQLDWTVNQIKHFTTKNSVLILCPPNSSTASNKLDQLDMYTSGYFIIEEIQSKQISNDVFNDIEDKINLKIDRNPRIYLRYKLPVYI